MAKETFQFEGLANFRRIPGTTIFRSARPDKLTKADVKKFKALDIKRIFDFRTCNKTTMEYANARGDKLIADDYPTYLMEECGEKPGMVDFVRINRKGQPLKDALKKTSCADQFAHLIFNMHSQFIQTTMKRTPKYIQIIMIILFFIDKIFKTLFFFKFFTWYAVNPEGMVGNYIDSINSSGKNICTGNFFIFLSFVVVRVAY